MNQIEFGDCRAIMRQWSTAGVKAQTCVTSPPYFGLRDYGCDGQIGLEKTPEAYVDSLVEVFKCVRDLLSDDGTLWLNIGDTYSKDKNRLLIPARVALALQADGWVLRDEIIWSKPNPMPEPVKDRCVRAHEIIYLLSKSSKYYFNADAIKEPAVCTKTPGRKITDTRETHGTGKGNGGINNFLARYHNGDRPTHRNKRSVWTVTTKPYKGAHFATFPPDLIAPCILAGCPIGHIVLDPFIGSGTTAEVALRHGRKYLGCELNPDYKALQDKRIGDIK